MTHNTIAFDNFKLKISKYYMSLVTNQVRIVQTISTLYLKKVPTFKLSVTLSNLNTLLESIRNLLQNPYDITHITLGMLLHYFGKLKVKF